MHNLTVYWLTMVRRFLLVSLAIDAILGEVTVSERRRKLNEMTQGNQLGDAYATSLARMKAEKGSIFRLGMEALIWVSNSQRPLHTSELCCALGVKAGSVDLDLEDVPEIQTILRCSLGLITVEDSSSTVRLVHSSLQEYLSSNPGLFQSTHSMMAEVCLTYLNFPYIRKLSPAECPDSKMFSLLRYASCYWGEHMRKDKTGSMTSLALQLLVGFEDHISSRLLLWHYNRDKDLWGLDLDGSCPNGFTGLHGAASLGIGEIVAALLVMEKWDVNAIDSIGLTALAWAAIGGHEDVVKLLLQQRDINANTIDIGSSRTPLLWAVERGHQGVVNLLLECEDISHDTADRGYSRTPFVRGRSEGVVGLLLKRGNINSNTSSIRSRLVPHWWAARAGDEGVVKLLLGRDGINPNAADTGFGRTPLWWAVVWGHGGIVKSLLERADIDPKTAHYGHGRTQLCRAVRGRIEGGVKLKRADINPNTSDARSDPASLWWAAMGGHEGVAKSLLERDDINPNTVDSGFGRTPLSWATMRGHEGIVKLLLERGDVDPNTPDATHSRTPIWWATRRGHESLVKLLLEREDINPNAADTEYGRTPLWWAARGGNEGIVKLLLELEGINPDIADTEYGRTPLSCAAECGHEGVVKLLLEREDINPNTTDTGFGRTPLWWAAMDGNEGITKLLLKREDLNPGIPGAGGETALELATSLGHAGVVELLSGTRPSLPIPPNTREALERPSPTLSTCHSPPKILPRNLRFLLVIAILSFVIISILIFLYYFLTLTGSSLLAVSLLLLYK